MCSAGIPAASESRRTRLYCSNACRQRAYRHRSGTAGGDRTESGGAGAGPRAGLDSFVGRQQESAALARLARHHRLITLFGPGGVGKTRMATQYAASVAVRQAFSDGVHMVELGGISRSDLVAQAVAEAVGATQQPGGALEDSLAEALGGKNALLVLDNCEHLVEACSALIASLLPRCPKVRVIATSRETLRLPGEKVFPVAELAVDDAMQLFADRATGVAAAFAVTPDNRDAVRSICERLDNLPLAVELAARLVRLLPLHEILNRLQDRFSLLTSDTRNADSRHRSLYAAIDWSYGLLSPAEQALLRRLSVLPGGFGFDLAGAVSADLGEPVIKLIAGLESKSLLTPVTAGAGAGTEGRARFRQLESVRAYAREQLLAHGEWDLAAEQLVAALTTLASAQAEQFTMDRPTADRLFAEQANLLFAIEYVRGRADPREVLLAATLIRCRTARGIISDSREQLTGALRVEGVPVTYRALALEESAWQAAWLGDHEAALVSARQAVELARDAHRPLRCRALTALAFAHQVCENYAEATANFAECLELLRDFGDPASIAICRHNLAWATMLSGDLDRAAALLDEILPIYRGRGSGEPTRLANVLHTAGTLELRRGDLVTAATHFAAGLQALGDQHARPTPYLLEGLAIVALRSGRAERGLRLAGGAESLRQALGSQDDEPWWQQLLTDAVEAVRARQRGGDADRALAQGRRLSPTGVVGYALRQGAVRPAPEPAPSPTVSAREREVAALVAQGSSNVEIATRLRISERTVESHLSSVRTKLDLRSRAHLAAWAARNLPQTG
ncbi:ATP-binding protein [Streptomyces sp. NPDC002156]